MDNQKEVISLISPKCRECPYIITCDQKEMALCRVTKPHCIIPVIPKLGLPKNVTVNYENPLKNCAVIPRKIHNEMHKR